MSVPLARLGLAPTCVAARHIESATPVGREREVHKRRIKPYMMRSGSNAVCGEEGEAMRAYKSET